MGQTSSESISCLLPEMAVVLPIILRSPIFEPPNIDNSRSIVLIFVREILTLALLLSVY